MFVMVVAVCWRWVYEHDIRNVSIGIRTQPTQSGNDLSKMWKRIKAHYERVFEPEYLWMRASARFAGVRFARFFVETKTQPNRQPAQERAQMCAVAVQHSRKCYSVKDNFSTASQHRCDTFCSHLCSSPSCLSLAWVWFHRLHLLRHGGRAPTPSSSPPDTGLECEKGQCADLMKNRFEYFAHTCAKIRDLMCLGSVWCIFYIRMNDTARGNMCGNVLRFPLCRLAVSQPIYYTGAHAYIRIYFQSSCRVVKITWKWFQGHKTHTNTCTQYNHDKPKK